MDSDPNRNVGRTDLSGELDSVPAPWETDQTPAVTRPGAGPASAMVIRSRARRGRGMNVESEMEFRPEVEFRQEMDIPAETCEGGLGAARPTTIDTVSRYITADKPEVTAIYTSQEVTTGFPTKNTQTAPPHNRIEVNLGQNIPMLTYGTGILNVVTATIKCIPVAKITPCFIKKPNRYLIGLRQILIIFQFFFSIRLSSKRVTKQLLKILPHLKRIATLPCGR